MKFNIKKISTYLENNSWGGKILDTVRVAKREMPSFFTDTILSLISQYPNVCKYFQVLGILNQGLSDEGFVKALIELGVPQSERFLDK